MSPKKSYCKETLKLYPPLENPLASDKSLPFIREFNFQPDCLFYGEEFTQVRELLGMRGPWRSPRAGFLKCPSLASSPCRGISDIPQCHQVLCIYLLSMSIYFCSCYHTPEYNCFTWTFPNVCDWYCFLRLLFILQSENLLKI